MAEKATYSKPASQVDLEERMANGNESSRKLSTAPGVGVAAESLPKGFVGVDPIYTTRAEETVVSEEGAESDILANFGEDEDGTEGAVEVEPETKAAPKATSKTADTK